MTVPVWALPALLRLRDRCNVPSNITDEDVWRDIQHDLAITAKAFQFLHKSGMVDNPPEGRIDVGGINEYLRDNKDRPVSDDVIKALVTEADIIECLTVDYDPNDGKIEE